MFTNLHFHGSCGIGSVQNVPLAPRTHAKAGIINMTSCLPLPSLNETTWTSLDAHAPERTMKPTCSDPITTRYMSGRVPDGINDLRNNFRLPANSCNTLADEHPVSVPERMIWPKAGACVNTRVTIQAGSMTESIPDQNTRRVEIGGLGRPFPRSLCRKVQMLPKLWTASNIVGG
jgi:hypothetical protein